MKEKSEQIIAARKQIAKQAKELVEKYEWDSEFISDKKLELILRSEREIEYWSDSEDLSSCWSLIDWITTGKFSRCLYHNFKEIEEKKELHYISIAGSIIDAFQYIPNSELTRVEVHARMLDNKPTFLIEFNNEEKFYRYDLLELQDKEPYYVATRMYKQWRDK